MRMRRFLAAALAVAMLAGNTMTAFATDVTPVPTNTGATSGNNEGTDTPGTPSGGVVVEPTPETTPVVTDAPTPEVTPDTPTPEATPTTPTAGEVTPTVPAEGEATPSVPVAGEVSPEVTPSDMVSPSVSPELSAAAMQLTKTYALGDDNREADENVLLTNYNGNVRAYYKTVAEAVEAANKKYAEGEKYVISLLPQMVEGSGAENVPLEFEVSVNVLNSIRKKSQLHMGGQILKIVCAENDPIPAIKCDITTIGSENYGSQILKQSEIRVVGSDSLRFVKPDYYDKPVDMEEHVYNNSIRQSISGDIDGLKITFTDTTNPNILIGEEGEPSASNASYACEIDFSNITLPDNCNLTIYDDFSTYNSTSNDLNVAKMVINTGCEYGEDSQLVNSESAYICYDNVTADEIVINGPTTLQANVVTGKLDMNYDVYFRGNLEVTGTFTNHESNAMLHGETRINNLVASKGTLDKSYYRTSFNIESTGSLHIENAMIDSNSKPNNEIIYLTRYPSGPNSAPEEGTVLATIGENCEDKLFAFGNYGGYMLERTVDNKLVLRQAPFAVRYNENGNDYSNYFLSIADVQDFIKTDTSGSSTYGIYLNKDTSVNGDLIFNKDTVGKDNVNITLGLGNHTLTFEEDATVVIDQITGNSKYGTIKVAQDKTLNLKSRSSYKNYYSFMDLYNVNLEFDPASTTGGLVIGDGSKDRGVLFGFTKTNDGKINLPHIYNAQNVDLKITSKFQYGYMADYYYYSNNISLSQKEFDAAGVEFNNIFVDNVSSNITSDFYYDVEFGTAVKVKNLLSANGDFKAYSLDAAGVDAYETARIAVKAPSTIKGVNVIKEAGLEKPEFKNIAYYCDNSKVSEGLICFSGSITSELPQGAIKLVTAKDKAEYSDKYYRTNYEDRPISSEEILATVKGTDASLIDENNYWIWDSANSFSTLIEPDESKDDFYNIKAYKDTNDIVVNITEKDINASYEEQPLVVAKKGVGSLKAAKEFVQKYYENNPISDDNKIYSVKIVLNVDTGATGDDLFYDVVNKYSSYSLEVGLELNNHVLTLGKDASAKSKPENNINVSIYVSDYLLKYYSDKVVVAKNNIVNLYSQFAPYATYACEGSELNIFGGAFYTYTFDGKFESISLNGSHCDVTGGGSKRIKADTVTAIGEEYHTEGTVANDESDYIEKYHTWGTVANVESEYLVTQNAYLTLGNVKIDEARFRSGDTVKVMFGNNAQINSVNIKAKDNNEPGEAFEFRLEVFGDDAVAQTTPYWSIGKLTINKALVTDGTPILFSKWRDRDSNGFVNPEDEEYSYLGNPFNNGEVLVYLSANTDISSLGTNYELIRLNGAPRSVVKVGNTLCVKTGDIVVSHEGFEEVHYPSFEDMAANLAQDFNSDKGYYNITILENAILTKDVVIPPFVTELDLMSVNERYGSLPYLRILDLNGKKLTTSARVHLDSGLRIKSGTNTKGQLIINAIDDALGTPALSIDERGKMLMLERVYKHELKKYVWEYNPFYKNETRPAIYNVAVSVPNGSIVLDSDFKQESRYNEGIYEDVENRLRATINAKNLTINGGNWEIPDNVTITNGYLYVSDGSRLITNQTITLNNSTTEFGQEAYVGAKNMTLAGSCLNVANAEVEVEKKINVTKANPAETYGEDTLMVMGDGGRVQASELVMPAGTISAGNNAKVLIENITKANNIRLSSNAGLVCDAITQLDAAKTYMSDGACLWVGSEGTINNIVLESDNAFLGRAEGAALTVNKSVTGTSEDSKIRLFVTNKEHKYSDSEDLLNNLDQIKNCTAADVVVPESESVLFNTGIAAFPVDRIEVWAWTTPGSKGQGPKFTENDAVYQSGNKMLVTGKFIEIFAAKANGDGEEYLKGFTTWKEASDYLNTLNNTSATYIVRFGKDIDINQALTLPKNVKSIVIASGKVEDSGNGPEPIPVRLSFIGDLALNTCTEFRDIELCPYVIKNGVTDNNYKATINTNGKDILFSNAQFVNDDYAVKPINTIKGTSTTNITMFDSDLSLASLSGINSITLIDSDITSSGALSVNTLYVTGMDESVVKVSGNANLEVKKDLIMEAKTTLDSAGKITLTNIQTENQGNLFRTATNGAITIKGIVSSYDSRQIGLQADIVSSDSGERFNGFKLADENAENVDARVMNNAIALSYGGMETPAPQAKLMANAVKAPATFFVASETGFVTGGKPVGTTVAGAVLRKDSGNLYTDYATDNLVELLDISNDDLILGQFKTVSQAFKAIDELANPEGRYRLLVKCQDKNLDTKGNVVDYKFPTKLEWLEIDGSGHEEAALMFKKDIKIGSDVVFIDIDISPAISGGTINLGNYMAWFENVSLQNDANNMNISGGGVNKGSELVFWNRSSGRKDYSVGNITNVGEVVIDSNTTLQVNGTANVGNIHAKGSESGTYDELPILKVGVKLTRAADRTVTKSTPNLTINGAVVRDDKLVVELFDSADPEKNVINNMLGESEYSKLTGIGGTGLIFAKAAKVETDAISLSETEPPYVYKKSGNLVAKITEPQVRLHGTYYDGYNNCYIESEFDSYADAIAEINSLKNKGDYTLEFIDSNVKAPITLTMPKAGTANSLTLTTSNRQNVPVYYTGNLALTTSVVLDNLDFVQVAKYDGTYSRVDEHNASVKTYSVPVNVSVGGAYTLDIKGKVTFNTPINLTGSNKATLDLNNGILVATARTDGKSASGYNADDQGMTYTNIEGSVAKFAKINVKSDTNITGYFKGSVPDSLGGSEPMPTYVGVAFSTNDLVVNNAAEFVVGRLGQTVDSLTVGNNCVNAGNITSYGNSTFKNLSLTNSGDIDVKGQTFKISGNVTSLSPGSVLYTTVSKKDGKSVLTIDGTVTLTDPEYRIGVAVSDTAGNYFEFGKAIPNESGKYYSNRLLNAKNGSIDSFVVSENLNSELYDENNNTTGYFLKKRGNEILVYYGEDVAVKLDINGDINYYTSFNEAVAAIDASSEAVEQCTITLLKHDVDDCYYENIKLPKKARNLTIMTEGDEPTYIVSSNKLTLSGNVKLKNIAIMAPEKKTFDIDTKNYQLVLNDSGIQARNITGNIKNADNKLVLSASGFEKTLLIVNSINGINTLDLDYGHVESKGTVNVGSLVGYGELTYGQLTVTNELKRDGSRPLELTKSSAITPAAITGVKVGIAESNKLATIGTANYVADGVEFVGNHAAVKPVWANGYLYAVDDSIYDRAVDVEYDGKSVKCLDMAQATNLIEKLNAAANDYVIKVGADISDPNITDTSAVSALKLPDKKKANTVKISSAKVGEIAETTVPVSITASSFTATAPLTLQNSKLITTGKSSATELALDNGSWVAYGATTIGSITDVTGGDSFLGTQLIKNVPQLTVTGDVNKNIRMKLFEQATKKEITDAMTDEGEKKAKYSNLALVIAKKAPASRFIASPYVTNGSNGETFDIISEVSSYKNKSNYVYNGDISGMEVILCADGLETYVKTYAEAIQIINNISDKNADYVIKLRNTGNTGNDGEIKTAVDKNGKAVYGALALPAAGKAASLTIESESDKLKLLFTGAVSPKCDLTFKNVEITEGKVSKGNFIPNNYITPNYSGVTLTLGDGVTTPGAAESLANDNYLINIGNENAVLPTPNVVINTVKAQDTRSAKGTLALSVSVYVKGKTEIADIRAENDVSLYTKSQTVLGSISGNNKLYLVTAYTDKAGKDWKTSASQLTINGELDSSAQLALVPYYYVLDGSKFLKPFCLDMLQDMAYYGENKPVAYKKLLTAPKLQTGGDNIKLISGINHEEVNAFSFVKYGGGVYITNEDRAVTVKGYSSDDVLLYSSEFFTWDQAVAEIEKLGHANDKTGNGGWNYVIELKESLGTDVPLTSVPMPSKANKVTIKGSYFDSESGTTVNCGIVTSSSSVAIKANTDLEIPIVSVKKSGNNYYDVAYTLNAGSFALNINNVPTWVNMNGIERRPLIKLTGNAKSNVAVKMSDNGDEIINQITNIGTVELNADSECVYLVANGISGLSELVIKPNVTVDTVEKEINVKKLTVVGENSGEDTPKTAIAIAKNITVTDTLTIGSAYLRAGTPKSGDGKVTLNNVVLKDNANVIEGKQDSKGGSLIQIKGTVTSDGADADSPAVEIGLYYNNSIMEYARLSEDMTMLTAPKAATSWFIPAYSSEDEDSIRMGAEIVEQLATMSLGGFETDDQGKVIHTPVRTYGLYKSGNYIKYGRLIDVEPVSIDGKAPELVQRGEAEALLYIGTDHSDDGKPYIAFKTFEEAVKAIDSMALKAADGKTMEQYTIKLNDDVYIGGDYATSKLKALTLPSRTSKLTVEGDSVRGFTKINFNGNITLKSNVTFVSCDLNSIKDAGGEVFSIPVNYAIGNWTLEMLNSSFDASNITGSAKSGTLILRNDSSRYYYAKSIKGLHSIILDNASIHSDGDLNVNSIVCEGRKNCKLSCDGNVVLNSINSDNQRFAIEISSDKSMKINGTQVTDANGKKEYVSITGSTLPVLKVIEGNKKLTPGTLLISGKYLSGLEEMEVYDGRNKAYNCYVRGDGLYLGNVLWK